MLQRITVGRVKPPCRGIVALLLLAGSFPAEASVEEADRLVAEGEALGREQRYEEALIRFKEAEKAAPRAAHDCWIAVTYHRLNRTAEARFRLDRCSERSNGAPAVSWYTKASDEVTTTLERGRFTLVDVDVEPAQAEIRALTLKDDQTFVGPRKIWLPLGKHTLEVRHDGFDTKQVSFVLETKAPYPVYVALSPVKPPELPPPPPVAAVVEPTLRPKPVEVEIVAAPIIEPVRPYGAWPWVAYGGAVAGIISGVFFYSKALGEADELTMKINAGELDEPGRTAGIGRIKTFEGVAWASFGVAAASAIVGTYLFLNNEPR